MEIYKPEKIDYMPSKKIYLARAGAIYSKILYNSTLNEIANKIYLLALNGANPVVYWEMFNKEQLSEFDIPAKYRNHEKFLIFLSTLGTEMDKEIERLPTNSTSEAALLDAWGSEAVEKLNDSFEKYFKNVHKVRLTMRFSPGYEDLEITRNKSYVGLLGIEDKITVLDSGLMIPRKSTSCIAAIIE